MTQLICEDCKEETDRLYHCDCGSWVCVDCGWYFHWQPRRTTTLALDGGDSAPSLALSTPEVLSSLLALSTLPHRK